MRAAGLVTGGLVVGGAAGGAAGAAIADHSNADLAGAGQTSAGQAGFAAEIGFYGEHQAGIASAAPAQLRFVSFGLSSEIMAGGRPAIAELQRNLSQAAADMTAGRWINLQSTELDGMSPAGLTITFGFGSGLIRAAGQPVPDPLAPLPRIGSETLDSQLSGGDLAIQICGQDELVVASAARALVRLARPAAIPLWTQSGFLPGSGSLHPLSTPRNLMGQLDGTDNPTAARLELAVWVPSGVGPSWMVGGTYLVTRRIRMLLENWGQLSTAAKEQVIGRRLGDGAPLSGGTEHTSPAFADLDTGGKPVIAANAHLRLTHPANNAGATMLRRGYSYDEGFRADGSPNAGLFFQAFQTDPHAVFVPIQRKLAASDALSPFVRHESSGLFAIPPGAPPGGWVGEPLLG
jgi:dye decolorizing peroxidase